MSIHYDFPLLEHIDDVLPYIDDKSFAVREKDCGNTYINYLRMGSETFPPVMGTLLERHRAAIRRECRGLAFNTETGDLVSRPFHKFFNVGESEYLTIEHFGFHRKHMVMDKVDGSMLRPIPTVAGLRWGTKMGITDTALLAETWLYDKPRYRKLALQIMACGCTPIFEFVSPENRIVTRYDEPNLILLAIRENHGGTYWPYKLVQMEAEDAGIPVVRQYDPIEGDPTVFFAAVKASDDLDEGVVVAFDNGHRGKAKTDQYSILHRVKDQASTERNLITAILSQEVDDLIPLLDETDGAAVREFIDQFWDWMECLIQDVKDMFAEAQKTYETKKDFAIGTADTWSQTERSIVFAKWDRKDATSRELALRLIEGALTSETKWTKFRENFGSGRLSAPTMRWNGKEDME